MRTRLWGVVGAGGENPPATRLACARTLANQSNLSETPKNFQACDLSEALASLTFIMSVIGSIGEAVKPHFS